MLVTLISLSVLVAGIICIILDRRYMFTDWIVHTGVIATIIGAGLSFVCACMIIDTNINPELQYRQDEIEYEILQEQVDSGDYKSATLTSDIIEYNQRVTDYKERYNSPWIGWFYYKECEKLPFVEILSKE